MVTKTKIIVWRLREEAGGLPGRRTGAPRSGWYRGSGGAWMRCSGRRESVPSCRLLIGSPAETSGEGCDEKMTMDSRENLGCY